MPSHTYVRVGRYHDASTANERASLADESYLAQCRQQGMYPGGYYPHNVHFLWFATDLEGRSADSIKAAKKVSAYTTDLRCGAIEGPRQRYLHLLAFARYGKWDDILAARDPGADYPFDRAMWHYARGLALAAKGRGDEAAQEHAKFLELERDEKVIAMDNSFFPGTKILAIADNVLAGKVAWARGRKEEAIHQLREGVKRENAMPYMEPPFWYYPVRESLGAVLLKVDKPAEAETAFREVLKHFPESGRALHGIELSLRQQGRNAEAKKVQRRFKKAWKHADTALDLSWF
jgi:tetratricopeptide (TPR) repeat protein